MPNENDQPTAEQKQAAEDQQTQPAVNLAGRHPDVVAKDPFYAEHEAAHGVTLDEKKWAVRTVNLDLRQTWAETKEFTDELERMDPDDSVEVEKYKPRVLDLVTTIVAGLIAERLIDSKEPLASEALDEKPERLLTPLHDPKHDVDRTVYYLQKIWCNGLEYVLAAEKEAREILDRRKDHLKDLAKMLLDKRVVTGPDLDEALGKPPKPLAPPAPAPEQAPPKPEV